ncbi:MAG TPA: VanZ family protein [Candidatus Paceibacterota bacterium]|nr:VanZ family protein [Candidatus Paceibacterota bacterium]
MKQRFWSTFIFATYIVVLIRVMVFKDIPTLRVGQLMLNFGGPESSHSANLIPFVTIVPYLLGFKGWIIAGVNLAGNIAPLVPLGFLIMLVYPRASWKNALALGVLSGLCIETLQSVLHVGIFDIDDVILNTLGVMIGYWAFIIFTKWLREKRYLAIVVAVLIVIAAAAAALYVIYPWGKPVINSNVDLCGGTGGIGQITTVGTSSFTIIKKDGSTQTVTLSSGAKIETPNGPATLQELQVGESVTLVGGPNPDESFTADTVLVCSS